MSKKTHIGACVQAAGSPAAGIVLYRLKVWKPNRKIDGRWWFAKSRDELMDETGLTKEQVKGALSKLRRDGLINTSQHLFHGKNVMHVLITALGRQRILAQLGVVPNGTTQEGPNGTAQEGPNGSASYTSYMQGDSQGDSHGDSDLAIAGIAGGSETGSEEVETMKTVSPKKPRMTSVKDVIAGAELKVPIPKPNARANSVSNLDLLWKQLVAEVTEGYVAPLTGKQLGQLKLFKGKLPPGKAAKVLRYAVTHWMDFTKEVEIAAGLKKSPNQPSLDFLLLHAGVAVNMMASQITQDKQEAKPVGKQIPAQVKLIAQKPAPTSTEDDVPASMADLMSILGEENTDGA